MFTSSYTNGSIPFNGFPSFEKSIRHYRCARTLLYEKQKRCRPLVLSEVFHERSTTADDRSASGSASYITCSRTDSHRKRFCIVHNVQPHQTHIASGSASYETRSRTGLTSKPHTLISALIPSSSL